MAEKEAVIENSKKALKALAVGAPAAYGGREVYLAGSEYFGAKHDLDSIHNATADFGKATEELVFQIPQTPSVRGVTFHEGSKFPNSDNAIGTAVHGRYELLEAGLVPEADRAQAIIRKIDTERRENPTSDFATQRQELRQLATDLNPHVSHLQDVKRDQYLPAVKGSVIALLIPSVWIGIKKWIERRRKKNDSSIEAKRGIISKLTELPSQNEEPDRKTPEAEVDIDEREPGWMAKDLARRGKLLSK